MGSFVFFSSFVGIFQIRTNKEQYVSNLFKVKKVHTNWYQWQQDPLHRKPYFIFPNVLKRWSFQKKSDWNIIFLVSSGKMIFLFPENMILFFRGKMKDDLSQKNTWKYNIFFKCSKKMVFPKKIAIFLISWRKRAFLFPENMIFFYGRKLKDDISQRNTWKHDVFCMLVKVVFFSP